MQSMLSSSLINTAAGLLSLVAGLGSSVLVARLLGVEGAGLVAYALWIMSLATLVSGFGMPHTVLRFIARTEGGPEGGGLVNVLTRRFALSTGIVGAALCAYAIWIGLQGNGESSLMWIATTVLFLTYGYSTMALAAAEGLGRFRESTFYAAVGSLIQPFSVLVGGLLLGPAGAIFGHALRHLPQALSLRRYMSKGPAAPSVVTPAMRRYARDNWLSGGLSAILSSRIELALIGLFFTLSDVGFYSIGITMSGMVIQVALFLVATLVPYLGHHYDRGDREALTRVFNRSLLGMTIVLAPISFGGAAIAPVLIPFLFGAEFTPSISVSVVLLVFCLSQALEYVPGRLLLATERSSEALRLSIVSGLISVILLMLVVPRYGGEGAAWAKGAVSVGTMVFYAIFCKRVLGVSFRLAGLFKVLAAAALCAAAARACMWWLPGPSGMLLGIVAGAVVYGVGLLALTAIPAEDRAMIADWAAGRIPNRFAGILRYALLVR
ncbi:oligosaccharide flippase family protein [Ciceribacter sp. L1K22]|uniref:lipopolysaccharide biosynthesis protein n=1 Tax=Ciceribacter sp. L1K22 TaxID=2820275 RepID=UPI001ABE1E38|nr:oligosaccharide flippase family protein [Ciceribacter sp. L1K22]MBO3761224.1 polysaccharide biosynthesis protein [Ciceribacter sp. L1K22]